VHNKVSRLQIYLILATLFFLQLTLSDLIKVFGAKPDLLALFVIFISLFFGWSYGFETGFAAGMLKDLYSLDIFGINTVALALTGLVSGYLSPRIFRESKAMQSVTVFVFTLLYLSAHYLITCAISDISYIRFSEFLFLSFIPVSLYTAVLSVPAFGLFINWFGLKEDAEYL
jgi:rod shape-determining protein MreD